MKPARYDQVGLRKRGGGYNLISRTEFEAMPLRERVRLIMEDQVAFLQDGRIISAREALGKGA